MSLNILDSITTISESIKLQKHGPINMSVFFQRLNILYQHNPKAVGVPSLGQNYRSSALA